jgi:hypothetical protein
MRAAMEDVVIPAAERFQPDFILVGLLDQIISGLLILAPGVEAAQRSQDGPDPLPGLDRGLRFIYVFDASYCWSTQRCRRGTTRTGGTRWRGCRCARRPSTAWRRSCTGWRTGCAAGGWCCCWRAATTCGCAAESIGASWNPGREVSVERLWQAFQHPSAGAVGVRVWYGAMQGT